MDKNTRQQYVSLVDFLGKVMGPSCEVVFHIIEPNRSYIAAITNNHISGRSINAPLTGLALEFMKNGVYKTCDSVSNYKGISKNSATLNSSTFFIKNEAGVLEGMLCFNTDVSPYLELANNLLGLAHIPGIDSTKTLLNNTNENKLIIEYFSESLKDIVYSIVSEETLNSDSSLKPEQKLDIVRELNRKGVFALKGAVTQVAEILKISEPSVYRYLKQIENED